MDAIARFILLGNSELLRVFMNLCVAGSLHATLPIPKPSRRKGRVGEKIVKTHFDDLGELELS
jgi:hypothetical protein